MPDLSEDVRATLEAVVRRTFPEAGVTEVRAEGDLDHDGEPILRVEVILDRHRRLDGQAVMSLVRLIRDALAPLGEDRFPIVSYLTVQDLEDRTAAA